MPAIRARPPGRYLKIQEVPILRIGVIGFGYWGPNLVRNFAEAKGGKVVAMADLSAQKCTAFERRYPGIRTTTDPRELINAADVDAVVIATPVRTHFELAFAAIEAGKHVMVEKPMTETVEQALRLVDAAARRGVTLMVDHTFVYTGAVRKIRSLVESGELGDVYYYDSTRINLGLFQHDVDVIWDLAVHDLAILDYVVGEKATAVSATGMAHIPGHVENVAYLTAYMGSGMIAHVNVNWLSPVKIRHTMVGGSRKMVVYDDLEPSEKLKIYDKGITLTDDPERISQMLVGYRTGDMLAPQIVGREALAVEAEHFIDCVTNSKTPITDGACGLRIVELCEAATKSMKMRGHPVEIVSR
ncbi:MAG: Gfo/Idh/MocA family oxidoreductase [Phaeospirillum sp.]|nr:Gfo/Idh/MocA family oxidoreductase [Phaeospirillum sp.]